jgi:hypothetical protein
MTSTVQHVAVAEFDHVVLENHRLRATVIPRLGGRVWELLDRVRDRQWIWHRDDVPLAASPPGSVYDEVWAGGWEELFPNDAPGQFEGRTLLDHGEWWTNTWTVAEASEGVESLVRLVCDTPIWGTLCTKEFRLSADADQLKVAYRIENRGSEGFHFLFKQHLPVQITPACTLVLPGGCVTTVDPQFGTMLPGPGPFDWPIAGGADLRRIPQRSSAGREFVYVTAMPDSWCGINDTAKGASLRMRYDAREVPFLWLFLSYGGWRDCYTTVLEPCTNMPKHLADAVRLGQSAHLAAGGVFATTVTVTLGGLIPNTLGMPAGGPTNDGPPGAWTSMT